MSINASNWRESSLLFQTFPFYASGLRNRTLRELVDSLADGNHNTEFLEVALVRLKVSLRKIRLIMFPIVHCDCLGPRRNCLPGSHGAAQDSGKGVGPPAVLGLQRERGLHRQSCLVGVIHTAICATGHCHVPYEAYPIPRDDPDDGILWESSGKSQTRSP